MLLAGVGGGWVLSGGTVWRWRGFELRAAVAGV